MCECAFVYWCVSVCVSMPRHVHVNWIANLLTYLLAFNLSCSFVGCYCCCSLPQATPIHWCMTVKAKAARSTRRRRRRKIEMRNELKRDSFVQWGIEVRYYYLDSHSYSHARRGRGSVGHHMLMWSFFSSLVLPFAFRNEWFTSSLSIDWSLTKKKSHIRAP